jgi:translation initiation factor 2 subunit 1
MMIKKKEMPEVHEIVIGNVTKINPYSIVVDLEEYPGKFGMVHISEISRKWVADIKEAVKIGQKVVARVISIQDNNISLSMKRISEHEIEEKQKAYKREQKAQRILREIAKELRLSPEDAYKKIGIQLEDKFGEMFSAFQTAGQNPEHFRQLVALDEKTANVIIDVSEKFMEKVEREIKGVLNLSFASPDGIEKIKKILSEVPDDVQVKYISAPQYSLSLKTKNLKQGERRLNEISQEIIKKAKAEGGTASFEVQR